MLSVNIHSAVRFHCAPDWSWDPGDTKWFDNDFWFVVQGEGQLVTPEGSFPLQRGEVFLMSDGQHYRGTHNPQNPLVVYVIHFAGFSENTTLRHQFLEADFMEAVLQRVVDTWHAGQAQVANSWFEAVLQELRPAKPVTSGSVVQPYQLQINQLSSHLKTHYSQAYDVQQMARDLGLSRQHFCRLFKAVVGTSPSEFLLAVRINAAKIYLLNSDHPIKRVAYLCGFHDESYFTRLFRQRTGQTPGAYKSDRSPRI